MSSPLSEEEKRHCLVVEMAQSRSCHSKITALHRTISLDSSRCIIFTKIEKFVGIHVLLRQLSSG